MRNTRYIDDIITLAHFLLRLFPEILYLRKSTKGDKIVSEEFFIYRGANGAADESTSE